MNYKIGKEIIGVSNIVKRNFNNIESIKELNSISGTNGFIIKYIYDSKNDVYQKDLEKEFLITRSTCSKILSLMEKKDLIIRQGVESDLRIKKLVLTDKAKELAKKVDFDIKKFDQNLLNGFSSEEVIDFLNYLERIKKNVEVKIWLRLS